MLQAFYSLFYSATKPFRSRYLYTGRPTGAIEHRSSLLHHISYTSIKLLLVFIWMLPEMVRTVSDYSAKLDMNARPKKEYEKSVFLLPHQKHENGFIIRSTTYAVSIYYSACSADNCGNA